MYDGIKVYSSVSDASNTLGQGPGEAWMLIYGWTDVIPEPIKLEPGVGRQITICIPETFPVKETGKTTLRQVRLQGKLRIVAEYVIPIGRIGDQSQGKEKRGYVRLHESSNRWTHGEAVLEIPIPCLNDVVTADCHASPQIFPGEHDVHTIELEPPPAIDIQPPEMRMLPFDRTSVLNPE